MRFWVIYNGNPLVILIRSSGLVFHVKQHVSLSTVVCRLANAEQWDCRFHFLSTSRRNVASEMKWKSQSAKWLTNWYRRSQSVLSTLFHIFMMHFSLALDSDSDFDFDFDSVSHSWLCLRLPLWLWLWLWLDN